MIGDLFSTLYFRDAYEYYLPSRLRDKVGLVTAVVHDMITWIERARELRWPSLMRKYLDIVSVLKRMDHVFCNSEATRDDVVRYTGAARSLTSVIYGSANPGTATRPSSYDFADRANAVVYVGGDMPRKNVKASIDGFASAYRAGRIPRDSQYFLVYKPDDIWGSALWPMPQASATASWRPAPARRRLGRAHLPMQGHGLPLALRGAGHARDRKLST